MNNLYDLSREELIGVMKFYDKYIIEYFENHDEGCPVCLEEFYNNEYKEMIESLYKRVCQNYCDTMSKELLLKDDKNLIHHIFVQDEFIELAEDGKININNYKKYLDLNLCADFEKGEFIYNSYKELYKSYVRDEIYGDIQDLGLYDDYGYWDFEISKEDLQALNELLGESFDLTNPEQEEENENDL